MDFIGDASTRAFGTRLRRLSERLDREVQEIYRVAGFDFEPRWFAVVTALRAEGPASVGELAARIGVTHAAVSQVRSALAARGLVHALPDPADQRRQVLALTPEGQAAADRLEPLWAAISDSTAELLAACAPDLLPQISRLEAGLASEGLAERVLARLAANQTPQDDDKKVIP
jgi:DNA-binding MarR family transcriptional regulator